MRLVDRFDPVALLRGEADVVKPVSFQESSGGRPRDLVGSGHPALFLVSDRVAMVLQDHAFTGWSRYDVVVTRKDGSVLEGYSGFKVTGRCGPLQPLKAELAILPPRTDRGRAVSGRIGLYFDPPSWDGSDVFCPSTSAHVLVLGSVRQAMQRARLTNVALDRASEIESIAI